MDYKTIFHKDGTITYWSVYQQRWIKRETFISNEELAAMSPDEREKVIKHVDL